MGVKNVLSKYSHFFSGKKKKWDPAETTATAKQEAWPASGIMREKRSNLFPRWQFLVYKRMWNSDWKFLLEFYYMRNYSFKNCFPHNKPTVKEEWGKKEKRRGHISCFLATAIAEFSLCVKNWLHKIVVLTCSICKEPWDDSVMVQYYS